MSEITKPETEVENLHPKGDAILVIKGQRPFSQRKFLVSTHILSLISPVFAALFSSNFAEGIIMKETNCPEITLQDDPDAMYAILEAAHFKPPRKIIDAKMLAMIAIHCDKYDCVAALNPRSKLWLRSFRSINGAEEYGFVLLAAYFFHEKDIFLRVSAEAQKELPPDFFAEWEKHEILQLLPPSIIDGLLHGIEGLLGSLQYELECVEGALGMEGSPVPPPRPPTTTTTQLPTHLKKLVDKPMARPSCNTAIRRNAFFECRQQAGLWPYRTTFREFSVSKLAEVILRATRDYKHSCHLAGSCPLNREMAKLTVRVPFVLDTVHGLSGIAMNEESYELL